MTLVSRRLFIPTSYSCKKNLCVRRNFRQNTFLKINCEVNFNRQKVEESRANQVDSGIMLRKQSNLLNVSRT